MTQRARLKRPVLPMPDFIRSALAGAKLTAAYEARPAYQRNDYIAWILRARREETRRSRLAQMLRELHNGGTYMNLDWRPRSSARRRSATSHPSPRT
ncbi:MAG: YdeI/OmpD-associated family protein [SAR202 cluster bacterium]|nr:YdeI/OmpD-associated family protein [SAR202 cluster bacterium]